MGYFVSAASARLFIFSIFLVNNFKLSVPLVPLDRSIRSRQETSITRESLPRNILQSKKGNTQKMSDSESATHKALPEKLLVGYTTNSCQDLNDMSKVTRAVQEGVNVLIWAFIKLVPDENGTKVRVDGGPNLIHFELYKQQLVELGHMDVIHLVSFGGWNGPHLPSGYDGKDLFYAFHNWNTPNGCKLFDGIDWDLEGEDNLQGKNNLFTLECLEQVEKVSQLAKKYGYTVSMAPAESYLDIPNSKFSRYVNLTYPDDNWHHEFSYHGASVYAYILAKWGDCIDFISVQFYESFSHAAYDIKKLGVAPHEFLIAYIQRLFDSLEGEEGYFVNFEQDETCKLKNQFVSVPLNKLVFGFANGWTNCEDEKAIFFPTNDIKIAYNKLKVLGRAPRGFMFWVIEEEGNGGLYYTPGLSDILKIRTSDS
mmetsp:Transcript_15774/g.22533  ORF Transcript_15774/g.22533 Transcript_15774/m.22533 type:complete len:425 (+) Transcript_15774:51-1325(+)